MATAGYKGLFNIGDSVIGTARVDGVNLEGIRGVVYARDDGSMYDYGVEWEKDMPANGRCWWVPESALRPDTPEEIAITFGFEELIGETYE